jgi:hypothetical protein
MPQFDQEIPVLVVGGSLVGLTTSVLSRFLPHGTIMLPGYRYSKC